MYAGEDDASMTKAKEEEGVDFGFEDEEKDEDAPNEANKFKLCFLYIVFSFASRMWEIGIVLLVAELTKNSLFIVAASGFMSSLAIFILMPSIGTTLDRTDRMLTAQIALGVKLIAVTSAYVVCAFVAKPSLVNNYKVSISVYFVPLFCAVASLGFTTIIQSIEKDWVIVLSSQDNAWLAHANTLLSQIDLGCSSVAPVVTGLLFSFCSTTVVAIVLLISNGIASILLYCFMRNLYDTWPRLREKMSSLEGVDENTGNSTKVNQDLSPVKNASDTPSKLNPQIEDGDITTISFHSPVKCDSSKIHESPSPDSPVNILHKPKSGDPESNESQLLNNGPTFLTKFKNWVFFPFKKVFSCIHCCSCCCCQGKKLKCIWYDLRNSGCTGVLVAYSFQSLSVLNFGPLMTVYFRYAGLSLYWIGLCIGASAIMGFFGALLFPLLKSKFGIWEVGQLSVIYQTLLYVLAASSFFWAETHNTVIAVAVSVLMTRSGAWLFDLCARQIAQETIKEVVRGKVNGQWRAMIAFFDMSTFALAIAFPNPEEFFILTSLSGAMAILTAITYTFSNPKSQYSNICFNVDNASEYEIIERRQFITTAIEFINSTHNPVVVPDGAGISGHYIIDESGNTVVQIEKSCKGGPVTQEMMMDESVGKYQE